MRNLPILRPQPNHAPGRILRHTGCEALSLPKNIERPKFAVSIRLTRAEWMVSAVSADRGSSCEYIASDGNW